MGSRTVPEIVPPLASPTFSAPARRVMNWEKGTRPGARTESLPVLPGAFPIEKAPSAAVVASAYRTKSSSSSKREPARTRAFAPDTGFPASSVTRPDTFSAAGSSTSSSSTSSDESYGPGRRAPASAPGSTRIAASTPGLSRTTRKRPSESVAVSPSGAGVDPFVSSTSVSSSVRYASQTTFAPRTGFPPESSTRPDTVAAGASTRRGRRADIRPKRRAIIDSSGRSHYSLFARTTQPGARLRSPRQWIALSPERLPW